jgi:hypothetical protein
MEHVTTKKRELAPALMARVDACAYIFMADKPEKIGAIMADRGVSELEAGRIYTIGALKAAKRRGTAQNYGEALELLEAEQIGDRGNPLTRSISADNTACTVAHYQHRNTHAPMRTTTVDVVRMAWARMDNQPLTEYAQADQWRIVEPEPNTEPKRTHTRGMGRILGSMYTDMEFRQVRLDPEYVYINTIREANVRRFIREYLSRLSRKAIIQITGLMEYIRKESSGNTLKAERVISALLSNQGKEAPETSKLANFAVNLHRNFTYKDVVTCPELIRLLYGYGGDNA